MAKYELPKDLMAFWQEDLPQAAGLEWRKLNTEGQRQTLIQAARFMDFLPWRGSKKTIVQNLCWPRTGVILDDGTLIADNATPEKVKECQIIIAAFIAADIPCDLPALAHVMLTVGHLLIPNTDFRKGDIRTWNSSIH
jgi:hypothetical protein